MAMVILAVTTAALCDTAGTSARRREQERKTVMSGFLTSVPAISVGYFAARAAVALILGATVGLERQWRQRTAGLRTNALVALGAALFELFAVLLAGAHGVDPTRIAAYVVSGIGFLGAGVILRDGVSVRASTPPPPSDAPPQSACWPEPATSSPPRSSCSPTWHCGR
jgi:MgtC family